MLLGQDRLEGNSFIDIGSGSGLFNLMVRRIGAIVVSIDCDPMSLACTRYLRDRFFPADIDWAVVEGSALDEGFTE
mgnify:CR=1 FL=1